MAQFKELMSYQSPLLHLPQELRDRIYEEALIHPKGIIILANEKPPGLLTACRQTRAETCSIYYASNVFYVTQERCLAWLKSLRTEDRLAIQRIRILKPMPPPTATAFGTKAVMLFDRIPVLRDLRFQLQQIEVNPGLKIEISILIQGILNVVWVSECVPVTSRTTDTWKFEELRGRMNKGEPVFHFFRNTAPPGRRIQRLDRRLGGI